MLFISKKAEPRSFIEAKRRLRSTPGASNSYRGLADSAAKADVLDALLEEQGYICAYCMRRIHRSGDGRDSGDIAHVEHYLPQNPSARLRASMRVNSDYDADAYSLDYKNMLAVCSGGEKSGKGVRICDKSRSGAQMLVIDPLDETKVALIEYARDGQIYSKDPEINYDLNCQLNLNSDEFSLCRNRMEVITKVDAWASKLTGGRLARAQTCERRKHGYQKARASGKDAEPFMGAILWRLDFWIHRWS